MPRFLQRSMLLFIMFLLLPYLAQAAPVLQPDTKALQRIRTGHFEDKLRIVFDLSAVPDYKARLADEPLRLIVDLPKTANKTNVPELLFNDPAVSMIRLREEQGNLQAVIEFKSAATYNIFTLSNPSRLVIDISRVFEQKVQTEVMPGMVYTSWLRGRTAGPVWAHILEVDPKAGFMVRPVLSNGVINGLETVSAMARNVKAVAAVNASYFSLSGEIIGFMKMDGEIISSPTLPRAALALMPDGSFVIDQAQYRGYLEYGGGSRLYLDGVNRERGQDEAIIYNWHYGATTGTNKYGVEYVIKDGKIAEISPGNTVIGPNTIILSAHGKAALALKDIKPGDSVNIRQTLGDPWDKAVHAIGAGPVLVKNNSVFLTTKVEEFGSDVAGGRAPRTAAGITKDGRLLLVVVDGRQATSVGMTLLELALFMQDLGAVDAMNLDGGGSSEMVVNDTVVNKPSDGKERKVGNALAIISAKLAI